MKKNVPIPKFQRQEFLKIMIMMLCPRNRTLVSKHQVEVQ